MKRFLVSISLILFCSIFLNVSPIYAGDESKALEARGTIKEKLGSPNRIVLTIPGTQLVGGTLNGGQITGPPPSEKEFIYERDNKKECLEFDSLKAGDSVIVCYKEKKDSLNAFCITYIGTTPTMSGSSCSGCSFQ